MATEAPRAKHRCPRHDVSYGALDQCAACVADPGPLPNAELDTPLPAPPAGCRSTVQLERALVKDLEELRKLRRSLSAAPKKTGKGKKREAVIDLHAYNTIAKLADATTKISRALLEMAGRREDEEIVKQRERRLRAMRGGRN